MAIIRTAISPIDSLKQKSQALQSEWFQAWIDHPDVSLTYLFYFDNKQSYTETQDDYNLYDNDYRIQTFINQFDQYQTINAIQTDFDKLRVTWCATCLANKVDPVFQEGFVVYLNVVEAYFVVTFLKELSSPIAYLKEPLPDYDIEAMAKQYTQEPKWQSACDQEIKQLGSEIERISKKLKSIEDRKAVDVDIAQEQPDVIDQLITAEFQLALDCKSLDNLKTKQETLHQNKSLFMTTFKQEVEESLQIAPDVSHEFKALHLEIKKLDHVISVQKRKAALSDEEPKAQALLTQLLNKDEKESLPKCIDRYATKHQYKWNPSWLNPYSDSAIINQRIYKTRDLVLKEFKALEISYKEMIAIKRMENAGDDAFNLSELSVSKQQLEQRLQHHEEALRAQLMASKRGLFNRCVSDFDGLTVPEFKSDAVLNGRRLALDKTWESLLSLKKTTNEIEALVPLVKNALKKQKRQGHAKTDDRLMILRDIGKRIVELLKAHELRLNPSGSEQPKTPVRETEPSFLLGDSLIPAIENNPPVIDRIPSRSSSIHSLSEQIVEPPLIETTPNKLSIGRLLLSGVLMAILGACVAYFLAVPLMAVLAMTGIGFVTGSAGYAVSQYIHRCCQRPPIVPTHLQALHRQTTQDLMMVSTHRLVHESTRSSLTKDADVPESCNNASEVSRSLLWKSKETRFKKPLSVDEANQSLNTMTL